MKNELNVSDWATVFVVCAGQLARLETLKAQNNAQTDEIQSDLSVCIDNYLQVMHVSRARCTEFIEKCNNLLSEFAVDNELHAALASQPTLQTAWSVWSGNEIQIDNDPIVLVKGSSVSSPSSKAEVDQASRCPSVLKVYPKVLRLEDLWPRSTSGKQFIVFFTNHHYIISNHRTQHNKTGMMIPLELVRQKQVTLTDAALVQVLGDEYCRLTGLITAATSTSLPMPSTAGTVAHHGHEPMHSRVSSAPPTSASKPTSHHPTTPATTSNTLDSDVNTDTSFMQIYRAGAWAFLSVLVAVIADRLAMGWYGNNDPL